MQIDFTRTIMGLDGLPRTEDGEDNGPPARLADVCVVALDRYTREGRRPLSLDEKRKRAALAGRIFKAQGPIDLDDVELGMLKAALEILDSNLLADAVAAMLEG